MKLTKYVYNILLLLFFTTVPVLSQELIIQENEPGFCAVDGTIETSVAGYSGDGYADTERGVGKSISWSVSVAAPGTFALLWQYANGGGSGDRPARLLINGVVVRDTINFQHTGTWTAWRESDSVLVDLAIGYNQIRIEAYSIDGLGNFDYFKINMLGQEVARFDDIQFKQGLNHFTWNATSIPTGVYFIKVNVNKHVMTKKVLVMH